MWRVCCPPWAFWSIARWLTPGEVVVFSSVSGATREAARSHLLLRVFWRPLLQIRLGRRDEDKDQDEDPCWDDAVRRPLAIARNWREGRCRPFVLLAVQSRDRSGGGRRLPSALLALQPSGVLEVAQWRVYDGPAAFAFAGDWLRVRRPEAEEGSSSSCVALWLAMVGGEDPPPAPAPQLLRVVRSNSRTHETEAVCWVRGGRFYVGCPLDGDFLLLRDQKALVDVVPLGAAVFAQAAAASVFEDEEGDDIVVVIREKSRLLFIRGLGRGAVQKIEKIRSVRAISVAGNFCVESTETTCRLRDWRTDRVLDREVTTSAATAVAVNRRGTWAFGTSRGEVNLKKLRDIMPVICETPPRTLGNNFSRPLGSRIDETDAASGCASPAFTYSTPPPPAAAASAADSNNSRAFLHASPVTALRFCGPLEEFLAVGQADGIFTLWHLRKRSSLPVLEVAGLPGPVLAIDADWRRLLLTCGTVNGQKILRSHTLLLFEDEI